MDFIKYIQGWIAIVGLMAFGNTVSCFTDHSFLTEKLYTTSPNFVNPLLARIFGAWTLLSAVLRLYCAIHISNPQVYNITLFSFVLSLLHLILEVFVYKTATVTIGIIMPAIVSGVSIIGMLIGYSYHPAYCDVKVKTTPARRSLKDEILLAQKNR